MVEFGTPTDDFNTISQLLETCGKTLKKSLIYTPKGVLFFFFFLFLKTPKCFYLNLFSKFLFFFSYYLKYRTNFKIIINFYSPRSFFFFFFLVAKHSQMILPQLYFQNFISSHFRIITISSFLRTILLQASSLSPNFSHPSHTHLPLTSLGYNATKNANESEKYGGEKFGTYKLIVLRSIKNFQ